MLTIRVLRVSLVAAGAALAGALLLGFLEVGSNAASEGGPVISHWESSPDPSLSRWTALYDGEVTFCLEDKASVGVDDAWVQDNLRRGWQIESRPLCDAETEPDLRIVVEDAGGPQPAGWSVLDTISDDRPGSPELLYQRCQVMINAWTFWQRQDYVWPGTSTPLSDVPEKTLLHEFGHCVGLEHSEAPGYEGAMYPVMLFYPSEDEVASLQRLYLPAYLFDPLASVRGFWA